VATAEAVVLAGAKPVFADINPETYNISPEAVEKAVTKKTKAIVAVDLYGSPADLKPIREIADKHGLKIIEDAAQAHGAVIHGQTGGRLRRCGMLEFLCKQKHDNRRRRNDNHQR
jgi:perosamine synthetase